MDNHKCLIERLQKWYLSQCDTDWEHAYGVKVETLDNPGWLVIIDLHDTELQNLQFKAIEELAPERTWIHCQVKDGKFQGAGGPEMLERILQIFLDWAETPGRLGA